MEKASRKFIVTLQVVVFETIQAFDIVGGFREVIKKLKEKINGVLEGLQVRASILADFFADCKNRISPPGFDTLLLKQEDCS